MATRKVRIVKKIVKVVRRPHRPVADAELTELALKLKSNKRSIHEQPSLLVAGDNHESVANIWYRCWLLTGLWSPLSTSKRGHILSQATIQTHIPPEPANINVLRAKFDRVAVGYILSDVNQPHLWRHLLLAQPDIIRTLLVSNTPYYADWPGQVVYIDNATPTDEDLLLATTSLGYSNSS